MHIDFNKVLRNEKVALMSDFAFRMTTDLLKAIDANDIEEILNIMIILDDETTPETIDKICEIDQKRNATVTESVTDTVTDASENVTRNVTRNAKSNAERQKRYRERNKKRNATVTESVTDTVTRNENVTLPQEERENEKEDEKEKRTKKEKEEERVKEKEELINIYALQPEKAKAEKPVKHRYGNFQHVFLTDDEYARLQDDFQDLPVRIQRLDDYLENNPSKHYANHNLTIRNWAKKDAEQMQMQPKQIPKEKTFRDLRIEMEQQEQQQDLAKQDYFVDSFWRA
jgi:hypothetical protein